MRKRIILAVVVIVGLGAVVGVGALLLKADQDAAVAQFGADTVNLCSAQVSSTLDGVLPDDAKVVFIDQALSVINTSYQGKVPAARKATSKNDVTHVVCVHTTEELYNTDEYGSSGKYTCKRYTRDLETYIFNVKTAQQIGYQKFVGGTPPDCPEKTDKSLTKYGDQADPADVLSGLSIN